MLEINPELFEDKYLNVVTNSELTFDYYPVTMMGVGAKSIIGGCLLEDENTDILHAKIKSILVEYLGEYGKLHLISTCDFGIEFLFARVAVELKQEYPRDILLSVILPSTKAFGHWSCMYIESISKILEHSDSRKFLMGSEEVRFSNEAYRKCDEQVLKLSDLVLLVQPESFLGKYDNVASMLTQNTTVRYVLQEFLEPMIQEVVSEPTNSSQTIFNSGFVNQETGISFEQALAESYERIFGTNYNSHFDDSSDDDALEEYSYERVFGTTDNSPFDDSLDEEEDVFDVSDNQTEKTRFEAILAEVEELLEAVKGEENAKYKSIMSRVETLLDEQAQEKSREQEEHDDYFETLLGDLDEDSNILEPYNPFDSLITLPDFTEELEEEPEEEPKVKKQKTITEILDNIDFNKFFKR